MTAASVTGQACGNCGAGVGQWCTRHGEIMPGALLTCADRLLTCNGCGGGVHKLELFPGGICLPCHAAKHEHDTPDQWLSDIRLGFGGR
jgi:hypothetical protein